MIRYVNTKCQSSKPPFTVLKAGNDCDSAHRVCRSNALFDGSMPSCEPVQCGQAEYVHNAHPTSHCPAGEGTTCKSTSVFKATISYACNAGFQPKDKAVTTRTCGADGSWSAPVACVPVSCGSPGAPMNAAEVYRAGASWTDGAGPHAAKQNGFLSAYVAWGNHTRYSYVLCDGGFKEDSYSEESIGNISIHLTSHH